MVLLWPYWKCVAVYSPRIKGIVSEVTWSDAVTALAALVALYFSWRAHRVAVAADQRARIVEEQAAVQFEVEWSDSPRAEISRYRLIHVGNSSVKGLSLDLEALAGNEVVWSITAVTEFKPGQVTHFEIRDDRSGKQPESIGLRYLYPVLGGYKKGQRYVVIPTRDESS